MTTQEYLTLIQTSSLSGETKEKIQKILSGDVTTDSMLIVQKMIQDGTEKDFPVDEAKKLLDETENQIKNIQVVVEEKATALADEMVTIEEDMNTLNEIEEKSDVEEIKASL